MTKASVINAVRVKINDEDEERWDDDILEEYLDDAQQAAYRLAPHLFTADAGTTAAPTSPVGSTTALGSAYRQALVDYVCSRALAVDNADTENVNLAKAYMNEFYTAIGAGK